MPSQKLTEAVLKNMPKPAKRTDIRDAQTTGLYLRVHPSGRKSWRMRYQFHDKPRVLSLGEWPAMKLSAARKAVLEHHETLAEGSDPAGDVQKAKAVRDRMPTVEEFAEEYIERHAKVNKKSWATDKRILDREVTPYGPRMDPEVTPKFSVKIVKISATPQISPARRRAAEVTRCSR